MFKDNNIPYRNEGKPTRVYRSEPIVWQAEITVHEACIDILPRKYEYNIMTKIGHFVIEGLIVAGAIGANISHGDLTNIIDQQRHPR